MSIDAEFVIIVDGEYYASTFGEREEALAEAMRYCLLEDGVVEVYEVTRKFICSFNETE